MNLARNIATTLSARVIGLGIALVSSMVLARGLGPEGRGLFALVLLLPELVKTFGMLGFQEANAVYAGLEPGGRRALVWHSALIAVVVGGLAAAGGACYVLLGAPGLQATVSGPRWLYIIPLAMVPGRMLTDFWSAVLRGMNRIFLLNLVEVGTRVASLALVFACVVWLGAGVEGAVWADTSVVVGSVLVLGALLASAGVLGWPLFDRPLWKQTAGFALPAHCGGVMTYMNYRIDQYIIALLLAPEQLAFYVIAVEIAERVWIIPGAIATALVPHLTNSPDRDPALAAIVARHAALWTGAGCLAVFVVAGVVVELLYSPAFAETTSPLRWLLPGIFTYTIAKVLVGELMARKKIYYTIWMMLIAASVNVAANLILIPRMGIAGAGLASSFSYSLVALIVAWYYVRVTGVPWSALVPCRADLLVYEKMWRRFRGSAAVARPAHEGVSS